MIQDGNNTVHESAFPADNATRRRGARLVQEMFNLAKPAPYLDAFTREKDRLIDALIKPELVKIANDPTRRRPAIEIDYDLFKNSIF